MQYLHENGAGHDFVDGGGRIDENIKAHAHMTLKCNFPHCSAYNRNYDLGSGHFLRINNQEELMA